MPRQTSNPKRSFVDVSDLDRFADRLDQVALRFDTTQKPAWLLQNGRFLEKEIRKRMPVGDFEPSVASRMYGPLASAFKMVEPGAFTFGRAFYWRFLEDGTVHIAPRGFIRKSIAVTRRPAKQDAMDRLMRVLKGFA